MQFLINRRCNSSLVPASKVPNTNQSCACNELAGAEAGEPRPEGINTLVQRLDRLNLDFCKMAEKAKAKTKTPKSKQGHGRATKRALINGVVRKC